MNMSRPLIIFMLILALPLQAGVRGDLRKGGNLYEDKKYGQALSTYNEILKDAPQNEEASFGAGAAAYQLKDYSSAQTAFTQTAEKEGELQQDALFNLGNTYYRAGNMEKAKDSYRKAIVNNPKDKEAIHNLQLILKEQKNQNNKDRQNNQNNSSDNQNNSGADNQEKQDNEQNGQNNSPTQEQKEAAERVMQMARESEYKKPTVSAPAQNHTVEKDW
jgi:Ca-activated chloride channel family protein